MKCLYCDGPYESSVANCKLCYNCAWEVFPVGYDDKRVPLHVKIKDVKKPNYELLKEATKPNGKRAKILDFWTVKTLNINKKKDVYEHEITEEPNYK